MSTQTHSDTGLLERVAPAKEEYKPPKFAVVIHNDDFTPMEFVVQILVVIFAKPVEVAAQLMLDVHHKGKGICGVYTQDIAETYCSQVNEAAERSEFPLKCTMEPVSPEPEGGAPRRAGPRP